MYFRKNILFICAAFLGLAASGVDAQTVVLKNGMRLQGAQFSLAPDGKLSRVVVSGANRAQVPITAAEVASMEWPDVKEVQDAMELLAKGDAKAAADVLSKAAEMFKPFRTVQGTPYNEVIFQRVLALDQAGDFDALLRAVPETDGVKWTEEQKLRLRIVKLNMERRTSSDQDGVLAQAKVILSETDDSAVSAQLWMSIGEIHFKKERFDDALMAYLHIPVFFGSQNTVVPSAELMAARTLTRLERFEDATAFYSRIEEAYPGSGTAEAAKKEKTVISGMKNKPDMPPAPSTEPAK